jgi:valyl-tRNA synthetase
MCLNGSLGLTGLSAREEVVKALQEQGLLERVEDYRVPLGRCYRCDTVIEPLMSLQWFVRMKPLAELALQVIREGKIRYLPERFARLTVEWLENIKDWCISRQIWWGHRIPIWYCLDCNEGKWERKGTRGEGRGTERKGDGGRGTGDGRRGALPICGRCQSVCGDRDAAEVPRLQWQQLSARPRCAGHLVFIRHLAPRCLGLA